MAAAGEGAPAPGRSGWLRRCAATVAALFAVVTLSGFFFIIPLPRNQDPQRIRELEQKGDWTGLLALADDRLKTYSAPAPTVRNDPTNPRAAAGPNDASASSSPVEVAWLSIRAFSLFKLERWEDAVAAYRLHLSKKAGDVNSLQNLGSSLFNLKRHREAAETFGQLTKQRPDLARAWYSLGQSHFEMGDGARVREIYEEVRKRDNVLGAAYQQNFLNGPAPAAEANRPGVTSLSDLQGLMQDSAPPAPPPAGPGQKP